VFLVELSLDDELELLREVVVVLSFVSGVVPFVRYFTLSAEDDGVAVEEEETGSGV